MTEQVPDTITIEGQTWTIDEWGGPFDCIPENSDLGFKTISRSTSNWEGRINHFLIFKGELFLFKIEVELKDEDVNLVPFGARREVRQIYEPLEVWDSSGMHFEERLHENKYFIFEDLRIKFTGSLSLSFPVWDAWDYPWPVDEDDLEPTMTAEVFFESGSLCEFETWIAS